MPEIMPEIAIFQKGGAVMYVLAAMSVYAVAVVIFKILQFRKANVFDRSFIDAVESCGLFWILDGICFAAERPSYANRDEAGQLHCGVGPAIAYPSGWSWWQWHGIEVPQMVIEEPERITVVEDLSHALARAADDYLDEGGKPPLYVLPTYTAMLSLRELLVARGEASSSWR